MDTTHLPDLSLPDQALPSQATPRRAARLREQLRRHGRPLGIAGGILVSASGLIGLLASEHGPALVQAGWSHAAKNWQAAAVVVAAFVFLSIIRALGVMAEATRTFADSNQRLHRHLDASNEAQRLTGAEQRAERALLQQQMSSTLNQVGSLMAQQQESLSVLVASQERMETVLDRVVERTDRWYPPQADRPQVVR